MLQCAGAVDGQATIVALCSKPVDKGPTQDRVIFNNKQIHVLHMFV